MQGDYSEGGVGDDRQHADTLNACEVVIGVRPEKERSRREPQVREKRIIEQACEVRTLKEVVFLPRRSECITDQYDFTGVSRRIIRNRTSGCGEPVKGEENRKKQSHSAQAE